MSNIEVKKEFNEFGKNIQIVAICTVLTIATGITGLIATIFMFIAIGSIKRANNFLKDSSLYEFRSNYIRGFISKIIGTVILIAGVVPLVVFFFIPVPFPLYISLSLSIILMLTGLIVLIVGVAAEVKAWKNLKLFFENNRQLFPENISNEVIEGCHKLKTGTILNAFGFLIIPGIIGFIYQIIGYFKLAKLNTVSIYDAQKASELQVPIPKSQVEPPLGKTSNFCPNCGAKLSGLGTFCALCGSELN